MKLSKFRVVTMHGAGLSHAMPDGGPVVKREYGGPPWWQHINGVWWSWEGHVYFLTFRRHEIG